MWRVEVAGKRIVFSGDTNGEGGLTRCKRMTAEGRGMKRPKRGQSNAKLPPVLLPTEADREDYAEAFLQARHVEKVVLGRFIPLSVALHLRVG